MYKYMREDTADDWGIKKLQDKILEIAVYVDGFCKDDVMQKILPLLSIGPATSCGKKLTNSA